jgi:hypothetical protein
MSDGGSIGLLLAVNNLLCVGLGALLAHVLA